MAKIVLGMGASHGPLLATPPEQWGGRVEADRRQLLIERLTEILPELEHTQKARSKVSGNGHALS